jgi:hypothetical protein
MNAALAPHAALLDSTVIDLLRAAETHRGGGATFRNRRKSGYAGSMVRQRSTRPGTIPNLRSAANSQARYDILNPGVLGTMERRAR